MPVTGPPGFWTREETAVKKVTSDDLAGVPRTVSPSRPGQDARRRIDPFRCWDALIPEADRPPSHAGIGPWCEGRSLI
jgi:hypothetical protein